MNSSDDMRPISVGKVPAGGCQIKGLESSDVPISMGIVPVIELALTLKKLYGD
jgi:hypothetical protein